MTVLGFGAVGLSQRATTARVEEARRPAGRKGLPNVERLEQLLLLSTDCPVISGFVFLDQNGNAALTNNGIFDPGELPIPNAQVELLDSSGHLLATATTNAQGEYTFDGLPNTGATAVTTAPQTITISPSLTPVTNKAFTPSGIQLFNPDLGTLTSVTISHTVQVNSTLTTQSVTTSGPANISANLTGSYAINGFLQPITGSGVTSQGPIADAAFDPANPDANKLAPINLSLNSTPGATTLTSPSYLSFFTASAGRTSISPTLTANAVGNATSDAGGLNTVINTNTSAGITVTYTYIPRKCITAGTYTLVQTPNPPNLINGKESQPGVVFPAPPAGQPQELTVHVTNQDLPNNDFAKLSAGNPNSCVAAVGVQRFGVHHQQTKLVVTFTGGTVDPTLANDPNSYLVVNAMGGKTKIVSATFDQATNSVLLIPAHKLNVHHNYDLFVKLPTTATPRQTVVLPFGEKNLAGFLNHQGQFVPVTNGVIPRNLLHPHAPVTHHTPTKPHGHA